jgi:hypothetical protein
MTYEVVPADETVCGRLERMFGVKTMFDKIVGFPDEFVFAIIVGFCIRAVGDFVVTTFTPAFCWACVVTY